MSRFLDASQLALTKLKTRRIRLFITLLISSLLFCFLLGAAFTVNGTLKSIDKFRKTGFSSRYIVTGYPVSSSSDILRDPVLVAQAKELQKQLVARKKAEANRLGIEYDSTTEVPYVNEVDQGPGGKATELNTQVPEVANLIVAKAKTKPGSLADFKATVNKYGATNTYDSVNIFGGPYSFGASSQPYVTALKDGKENFNEQQGFNGPGQDSGINSLSSQWQLMSGSLLKPFVLPNQDLNLGSDGSIPIIAPYTAVEQMLGLKALPATATSDARLARLKEVRSKAAGYKFLVCYRNLASVGQIQQATQQQQEIEANKTKKGYQLPEVVHALPTEPCGPVQVTRDVRTADQKALDDKEATFKREFGEPDPESKLISLRIVGVNSDSPNGGAVSITQIFQSVLLSSLGQGWATPLEVAPTDPIPKIFGANNLDSSNQTHYAEFAAAADVEKVLNQENCQPAFGPGFNPGADDPFKQCIAQHKYFTFAPFGSSSVALDHFKKGFDKVFRIVGLVMAAIATLILMGTIGRIIADSRRETAVFRAIGAKRRDIAQIYFMYTLMVALLIVATSTLLGYVFSQFIDGRYASKVTVDALVAFNITDLTQKFSMSSLDIKSLLYVAGLIVVAALMASLLPLLTNLRRNPIRDMRDER